MNNNNTQNAKNRNSWIGDLPKSMQWLVLLLFKISAVIVHREHHISKEEDIPKGWEWFYSDSGLLYSYTDVVIYFVYVLLFLIIGFKFIQSIFKSD